MATLPFTMTAELRAKLTATAPLLPTKFVAPKYNLSESQPGDPKLFLMTDPELPCQWLVLYGWQIADKLVGDVVYRGACWRDNEREPQFCDCRDNVYLIGYFAARTHQEI